MRDKITINELNADIVNTLDLVNEMNNDVYRKEEIDSLISGAVSNVSKSTSNNSVSTSSDIDLSNYYTKTEIELYVASALAKAISDHNSNTSSHQLINTRITELVTLFSGLGITQTIYTVTATEDGQSLFTLPDEYDASGKSSNLLITSTGNIITEYTMLGKTINVNDSLNNGESLHFIVFSVGGVN